MTDTQYSTLNTPCIWLGIPECRMWILPHFKIPHSNTWIWCWSLKCSVLMNRHKFRAWTQNLWWILNTLLSGFTLHTQDSPIQIHWVLSVECWVSVISLGPGQVKIWLSLPVGQVKILRFFYPWPLAITDDVLFLVCWGSMSLLHIWGHACICDGMFCYQRTLIHLN